MKRFRFQRQRLMAPRCLQLDMQRSKGNNLYRRSQPPYPIAIANRPHPSDQPPTRTPQRQTAANPPSTTPRPNSRSKTLNHPPIPRHLPLHLHAQPKPPPQLSMPKSPPSKLPCAETPRQPLSRSGKNLPL